MKCFFFFQLLSLVLLSGCAPGLGTNFEMAAVPPFEVGEKNQLESYEFIKLRVEPFTDQRSQFPFIVINGRPVETSSKLGAVVQGALEEALKAYGGKLCLFDCQTIGGEIRAWSLDVTTGFPTSKSKSKAEIVIWIKDKNGKDIVKGIYRGAAKNEQPLYNEEMMTKDLGIALNQAIRAFFSDEKVIVVLNRS